MPIEAAVIADSISPQGHRLTSFKLRYPKFIHGEFMTHRVISRNASSSRAIPTAKLIEEVRSDALRAAPMFWGTNQKGMQAAEELAPHYKHTAQVLWRQSAEQMANTAEAMVALGVHKQIVNRLLEPFSHINVVASATEWDNFFGLRLHRDAQPEMRVLAMAMWEAREFSTPKNLEFGKWHLPFINQQDHVEIAERIFDPSETDETNNTEFLDVCKKVSVARCARVSYESFETGKRSSVEEDLALYDRLLSAQPLHASPAEHQATPDKNKDFWSVIDGNNGTSEGKQGWQHQDQWGNFQGWRQFRKSLPGEACAPLPEAFRRG